MQRSNSNSKSVQIAKERIIRIRHRKFILIHLNHQDYVQFLANHQVLLTSTS